MLYANALLSIIVTLPGIFIDISFSFPHKVPLSIVVTCFQSISSGIVTSAASPEYFTIVMVSSLLIRYSKSKYCNGDETTGIARKTPAMKAIIGHF